jgi:hypothetical protein
LDSEGVSLQIEFKFAWEGNFMAVLRVKRSIVVAAVSVLMIGAAAGVAPASRSGAVPISDNDLANTIAASQLANAYGIEYSDALARMQEQPSIAKLSSALKPVAGFGGLYVDHTNGGQVIVQETPSVDKERLSSLIRGSGINLTEKTVAFSLASLEAAYSQVNDALTSSINSNKGLAASISIPQDRVVVELVDGAPMTPLQSEWYSLLQASGLPVVLGETSPAFPGASECSVQPTYCDPPLRGGVWTSIGGDNSNYCTLGFNATSNSDGKPYSITAGHCNDHTWHTLQVREPVWHVVGPTHSAIFNSSGDAQSITVNYPSGLGWQLPSNYVVVTNSYNPNRPTSQDVRYGIGGIQFPYQGEYLCYTGATTQSQCGQVSSVAATLPYEGVTETGLIKVSTQHQSGGMCQGDSGGPVYVGHEAFGILVAYGGGIWYQIGAGPNGQSVYCGADYWYAEPISVVESLLHVTIDGT